jgi:hypothetical protein
MPYPYEVLKALHAAQKESNVPLAGSLGHDYTTDGNVVCNAFAGSLLENIAGSNFPDPIKTDKLDPNSATPEGTFFYFSVLGNPSKYNHAFCMYLWSNSAVVIQVFLNEKVKLFRRMTRPEFFDGLSWLRSGRTAISYERLFGVLLTETFTVDTIYTTRVDP